jgi:hypothetical protein
VEPLLAAKSYTSFGFRSDDRFSNSHNIGSAILILKPIAGFVRPTGAQNPP